MSFEKNYWGVLIHTDVWIHKKPVEFWIHLQGLEVHIGFFFSFSRRFEQNICIHYHLEDRTRYIRFTANDNADFIHLRLLVDHYTPYAVRNYETTVSEVINTSESDINECWPVRVTVLTRYLVTRATLPIAANASEVKQSFAATKMLNDHPFAQSVNQV